MAKETTGKKVRISVEGPAQSCGYGAWTQPNFFEPTRFEFVRGMGCKNSAEGTASSKLHFFPTSSRCSFSNARGSTDKQCRR